MVRKISLIIASICFITIFIACGMQAQVYEPYSIEINRMNNSLPDNDTFILSGKVKTIVVNRFQKNKKSTDESWMSKNEYNYSEDGKLIKSVSSGTDMEGIWEIENIYHYKNQQLSEIEVKSGANVSKKTFTYKDNTVEYYEDGNYCQETSEITGSKRNVTVRKGKSVTVYNLDYINGKLQTIQTNFPDIDIHKKTSYKYSNNRIATIDYYINDELIPEYSTIYTFMENRLKSVKQKYKSKEYEYEILNYDSYGNWLKQTDESIDSEWIHETTREITYR